MQTGAWLSAMSKGVTVNQIGDGEEFFTEPSPIGVPRPLPVLWRYWDYVQFGDSELPDKEAPGSARLWREFRIVHRMYSKWKALRDGDEEVTLQVDKTYDDRYIPNVKSSRKSTTNSGTSKRKVPHHSEVP